MKRCSCGACRRFGSAVAVAVAVMLVVVTGACAGASRPRGAAPAGEVGAQERGGGGGATPATDERGMEIATVPLTLKIGLQLSGSREGPLRDGDTVVDGDHIQISIQTSEDAYLYLAYCNANRQLDVYPEYGGLRTRAGEGASPPALTLDTNAGPEALYVILSRGELASADPRLAKAIRAAQPGGVAADCGALTAAGPGPEAKQGGAADAPRAVELAAAPRKAPPEPAKEAAGRRGLGLAGKDGDGKDGGDTIAAARPQRRIVVAPGPRPVVTIERGMYVGQNGVAEITAKADVNGVAILRYRFQHVAARP